MTDSNPAPPPLPAEASRAATDAATAGPRARRFRVDPARVLAFAAVAFCWPLLFVGGVVTTFKFGMAVPDWPTTFGVNMFVYNMSKASWGVFVEHGHRLYGSAMGICAVAMMVYFLLYDSRRSLKILWVAALLLVVVQGQLGGNRVLRNSTDLAMIHGCVGQAIFAFLVALWVMTGRAWLSTGPRRVDPARLRWLAPIACLLVFSQIVAGAWLRHHLTGLEVHATLAAVVAVVLGGLAALTLRHARRVPELVPAARFVAAVLVVQLLLGVAAWWLMRPFDGYPKTVTSAQAIIRTGHQAIGALVLAGTLALAMLALRRLRAPSTTESPRDDARASADPESASQASTRPSRTPSDNPAESLELVA